LKSASWFFTLLLGTFLFYAFTLLPPPRDSQSILSVHVSARYAESGEAETGIHSQTGAILADYRGFDLAAAAVLFTLSAFGILLFFNGAAKSFPLVPALLWQGGGALLVLGVGFLCLLNGSNFLDYEALASWAHPFRVRMDGALILTGGALLSLGGLVSLFVRRIRAPEGSK
jgi:hypothetical protein